MHWEPIRWKSSTTTKIYMPGYIIDMRWLLEANNVIKRVFTAFGPKRIVYTNFSDPQIRDPLTNQIIYI